MQKRGTLVLRLVFELALSFVIISGLLSISRGLGTQQTFVKQSLEEEGALVMQELQHVPGNIVLRHPRDVSDFIVRLESSEFVVVDTSSRGTTFLGKVNPAVVQNSKELYFYKNGNEISIAAKKPVVTQRECVDVRLDRSRLEIQAEGAQQDIAKALAFKCSEKVCASGESSKDVKLAVTPSQEGIAAYFSVSSSNKDVVCTILNNMLARDSSLITWLVPGKLSQNYRIEVQPSLRETLGTVIQESS